MGGFVGETVTLDAVIFLAPTLTVFFALLSAAGGGIFGCFTVIEMSIELSLLVAPFPAREVLGLSKVSASASSSTGGNVGLRGGSGLAAAIMRASSKIAGNVGLIIGGNVSFGKGGGGGGSGGGSGGGGGGSRVAVGRGFSANESCSLTGSAEGGSLRENGSLTKGVSLAGAVSLT